MRNLQLAALLLFIWHAGPAAAAPVAMASLEAAAAAARTGDQAAAAAGYEAAIASGHANGHVFYNLGIAYYRLGREGDSVAAFLAARRLLPRDPDVAANLRFALAKIPDRLEPERPASATHAALFFLDYATPRELAGAAAALAVPCGLLLGLASLLSRLRPLRPLAFTGLGLAVVLAVALAVRIDRDKPWGAVTAKAAPVRSGPTATDTVLFELHAGAPALVEAKAGGQGQAFHRIALSDGKKGWIAASDINVFDF